MSICLALASGKGGVGKSTVAAHLGAALSLSGMPVIVMDTDIGLRSQDVFLSLENRVVYDLIDLANGRCQIQQCLLSSETFPNLYLIPAAQFARARDLEPKQIKKIIRSLRSSFSFILLDCPAGIERGFRNTLISEVDDFILVTTPDDLSLRSAERTLQVIETKRQIRPSLIVNRLNPVLIRNGEMMSASAAAQILDLPLLGEIPDDDSVYRSQLRHALCLQYDCEARNAFLRIASRLQGNTVPLPAYGSRRLVRFRTDRRKVMKEVLPIDNH